MRTSELAVGLLFMVLGAGCEALVQFKKVPESTGGGGTGASGGASSTGGNSTTSAAGGSGGASSSGATSSSGTTSTPPMQCKKDQDCGDETPCSKLACANGFCQQTNAAAGTPVSNANANDCSKEVCDGNGAVVSVADDTEVPAMAGDFCSELVCQAGMPVMMAQHQDELCGSQPANPCQKAACDAGECLPQNVSDGVVVDSKVSGSCNDSVCIGGMAMLKANDANCTDSVTTDCKIAVCNSGGVCGMKNAGLGAVCVKSNTGQSGLCDQTAHCCNLSGCD